MCPETKYFRAIACVQRPTKQLRISRLRLRKKEKSRIPISLDVVSDVLFRNIRLGLGDNEANKEQEAPKLQTYQSKAAKPQCFGGAC